MNIDKGIALHNEPTGVETIQYGKSDVTTVIVDIQRANQAMERLEKYQSVDYSQEYIAQQQLQRDYEAFSKLSTVEKRKMLRRMVKRIPLAQMNYEQAKLYHRLRGRIK